MKQITLILVSIVLSTLIFTAVGQENSDASQAAKDVPVLLQKGDLFKMQEEGFVVLEEKEAPKTVDKLRIGEIEDAGLILVTPEELAAASVALSYSERDLITLSNGSTIVRSLSEIDNLPNFEITGAVHVFIRKSQDSATMEEAVYEFKINDIFMSSSQLHLFYNDLKGKPELTVVEGMVTVSLPSEEIEMGPRDRLVSQYGDYRLRRNVQLDLDPVYRHSLVPGFEVMGEYRVVGTVAFDKETLQLTRYGKTGRIPASPVAVMEGDEIMTGGGQNATLELDTKDTVQLSPDTRFSIEEFYAKPGKESINYKFLGKIRAKVVKRKKLGKIRFKTVTAMIGVKGTELEIAASEQMAEVATIEGVVGVSDPDGFGEVEVSAGMMTTVAAGALPTPPVAIPAARLSGLIPAATPSAPAVSKKPAAAESTDLQAAPQIMTSDLARSQLLKEPTRVVTFVVVDDDFIEQVVINGEPQEFESDTTVVVTRKFRFKPGKTLIKVEAVDIEGNKREKTFLVGYGLGADGALEAEEGKEKESKFFWMVQVALSYETDDNPTNDLSLPIKVEGMDDNMGVVDDNEQTDTRQVVNGTFVIGLGNLSGFLGGVTTTYTKEENEDLNSKAMFGGVAYNLAFSESTSLLLNYLLLDVDIGGSDFSQNQTVTPGFQFTSKDEDGTSRHFLGFELVLKDFADEEKPDGSQNTIKWEYYNLDAEKLDSFRSVIAFGNNTDGTDESESTYAKFGFDWKNTWEIGFKWDLGFGFQYHKFENQLPLTFDTPLGETRADVPLRLSTGMGWEFTKKWSAMYNYEYVVNVSNKELYVRSIHGLTVSGAF
ncbi:MAG: FecR domain-containing protein [Proteobacteria bacterium]|nr:FecR domain-containing protein [Pseudomonadota bacterium]